MPLLCLPALTRSASDFDDLVAAVGDRHRLIRLTPRGRGASDRDPDFTNYNVATEARDVVELVDHLGLDRVVVIGTSRGGMVAMLLAARAKERLAGVLLNDIGPELAPERLDDHHGMARNRARRGDFEEAAAALQARLGSQFTGLSPERWLTLARRWFDDSARRSGAELRSEAARRAWRRTGAGRPWTCGRSSTRWTACRWRWCAGRTRIGSRAEMVARMLRSGGRISSSREVPERGHAPFLDEPEALAALEELLARVAA